MKICGSVYNAALSVQSLSDELSCAPHAACQTFKNSKKPGQMLLYVCKGKDKGRLHDAYDSGIINQVYMIKLQARLIYHLLNVVWNVIRFL